MTRLGRPKKFRNCYCRRCETFWNDSCEHCKVCAREHPQFLELRLVHEDHQSSTRGKNGI